MLKVGGDEEGYDDDDDDDDDDFKVRRPNVYKKAGDPSKHKLSCITVRKSKLL
jgi:hypothetical protein